MTKMLDLTLDLHEGMATYPSPWHPVVDVKQMGRIPMEDLMGAAGRIKEALANG